MAATLLLALIVTLVFSPFIFGHRSIMESTASAASLYSTGSRNPRLNTGVVSRVLDSGAPAWQTEPWFVLEHNLIAREHSLPVWNPYSGYGLPLAANMQSQVFFPPTWIAIAFDNSTGYAVWLAARLFLAGFFMYSFLRRFVGEHSAFLGALAYMFTGYLLLYLTMPEQSVSAVLPALFWALEELLRRPGTRSCAFLALSVAAILLGGMPEIAMLGFLLAAAYFAVRAYGTPTDRTAFGFAVFGTILGIAIAAVQVLPFLEYVVHSTTDHAAVGALVRLRSSGSDDFDFSNLVTYVAPLANGPPLNNIFSNYAGFSGARGFFGVAVAVFALYEIIATVRMGDRGKLTLLLPTRLFAIVATSLVLRRFGSPAIAWIAYLPVIKQISLLKYEEVIVAFCVAALAAAGLERMTRNDVDRFAAWFSLGVILMILCGYTAETFRTVPRDHASFYFVSLIEAMVSLSILLAVFLARKASRATPRQASIVAIVIVVANAACYVVPMFYVVERGANDSYQAANGMPYVEVLRRGTRTNARIFGEDEELYPNWSSAFSLFDVRALDALLDERYLSFANIFLTPTTGSDLRDRFTGTLAQDFTDRRTRRFLELSSVDTIIARQSTPGSAHVRGLMPTFRDGHVALYRFAQSVPRVAIYESVLAVASGNDARRTLADPAFDPTRRAVVESALAPLGTLTTAASVPVRAARIDTYQSTYVSASATSFKRALVVLNDTNYPGWIASIDGRRVPILASNFLFRGVVMPPGTHIIEFTYRAHSYEIGATLTAIALVVVIAFLLPLRKLRSIASASAVRL